MVVALTASRGGKALGISGLTAPENRYTTLLPLATIGVTGLINQFVLRPLTMKIMRERKHQGIRLPRICLHISLWKDGLTCIIETRDGKKSYDPAPHSKEMVALNKRFARVHGVSSLVNLVSFVATIVYGVVLSKRLE